VADNAVQFELVSPEKLLLSEEVEMVVVPGAEGDFGVLPGHTPVISTVRPGVIHRGRFGQNPHLRGRRLCRSHSRTLYCSG